MSLKNVAVIALVLLGFVAAFTAILTAQRDRPPPRKPAQEVTTPIEGKLDIRSIDDLSVGGQKILLCGVAFTKPVSLRALVTEAARRDYQGAAVTCRRLGTGTPCDGKMAARFGEAIVVQCLTDGDIDLAATFSARGFLCDIPAQSGGRYEACSKL